MKKILLAGNGDFANHGCEAIARGAIEILERTFGSSVDIVYAAHNSVQASEKDVEAIGGERVEAAPFLLELKSYSRQWIEYQINRFAGTSLSGGFRHLQKIISEADLVLSIGGDNYSLDYGYPERFVQFDRLALRRRKTLGYWGVSVGPFTADQRFERQMQVHLKKINMILARELDTVSYLKSLGVTQNVRLVADPAFAMSPVKPDSSRFVLDRANFLGVNFSTTVGRLLLHDQRESDPSQNANEVAEVSDESEYEMLCKRYADISSTLMQMFDGNLVFIPHVTGGVHCDYRFMSRIADHLELKGLPRPLVVPDNLTAPEYKWVISQARMFIGARTHSTIAAFSSGVPTISLSYSAKARGLSRDMFGKEGYCIAGADVTSDRLRSVVQNLLNEEQLQRERLRHQAEVMRERAYSAGTLLAEMMN